jgi:hypothetical protein
MVLLQVPPSRAVHCPGHSRNLSSFHPCDPVPSRSASPQAELPPIAITPDLPHWIFFLYCRSVSSYIRSPYLSRLLLEFATQYSRCLMCGAPTLAAHRSAAPTAYPIASRSRRTPESHSRPSFDVTCSPNTIEGRHWATSHRKAGHKCRSSVTPAPFPAALNG